MKWRIFILIIIGLLCIGITTGCYICQFHECGISSNPEDWAFFGNYTGGVLGPLFGLISIYVVCWTFYNQNTLQRIQQLDSSFFNLLSIQREIVKSIEGQVNLDSGGVSKKLQSFDYVKMLAEVIQKRDKNKIYKSIKLYENDLLKFYKESEMTENSLEYYFRHLYHIFKYVDESDVPDKIKGKYIDIIQAQMSDDELYLCFINSYSEYGKDRFYPLLAQYHFFENIKSHGQNFDKLKTELYPKTSFKHLFSK